MYSLNLQAHLKCGIQANEELCLCTKEQFGTERVLIYSDIKDRLAGGVIQSSAARWTLGLADGCKVQQSSTEQRDSYFPCSLLSLLSQSSWSACALLSGLALLFRLAFKGRLLPLDGTGDPAKRKLSLMCRYLCSSIVENCFWNNTKRSDAVELNKSPSRVFRTENK